ncbi:helix-turn-helix domain-containing protein [Thermoactinomyces sp. DSM 45892]|uniref:helix-turn-helix domain-containing protein n=1 Tax=Thermoactinomyces sp. DSM 45892 TaxID=1882753 RepID=UPI00089C3973|nr:helix-turn-helix transcriptional regulator [Thermoactinomyces sp. DSM 45892]SDY12955.1 Helix-turn-helix domain-containing protein [Thermoactinomyces sp. DSM 45892]
MSSYLKRKIDQKMKDPVFAEEWAKSEPEYKLRRAIAKQLSEGRKKRGLTQTDVAERMQAKQSMIGRAEAGQQNLTLDSLSHIADALGYEVRVELVEKEN